MPASGDEMEYPEMRYGTECIPRGVMQPAIHWRQMPVKGEKEIRPNANSPTIKDSIQW